MTFGGWTRTGFVGRWGARFRDGGGLRRYHRSVHGSQFVPAFTSFYSGPVRS
ncbi:hypothetical protein BH20ACT6_BH20ACT6_12520 [soil metagenome]